MAFEAPGDTQPAKADAGHAEPRQDVHRGRLVKADQGDGQPRREQQAKELGDEGGQRLRFGRRLRAEPFQARRQLGLLQPQTGELFQAF